LFDLRFGQKDLVDVKAMPVTDSDENLIKIITGTEYDALFSARTGFLQKFVSKAETIVSKIKLAKYGTTQAREKSGAYLFLPDGPAIDVDSGLRSWVRVETGPLRTRVCVNMTLVMHCVEILPTINKAKGFKIPYVNVWNVVDLRKSHNYELIMLVQTKIDSGDTLYTDLNGFQYTKRRRHAKLTLQGNVYPMPTGAFIQDSKLRFNILTGQPLGVASLESSQIQVFLDRRLNQDDNRGMEQSMDDNIVVANRFVMFFDSINTAATNAESAALNFPSLMSTWLSNDLLYPVVKLVAVNENAAAISPSLTFTQKKYPCDLHLINMRTMQNGVSEEPMSGEVGLIFHRVSFEDCASGPFVQLSNYIHSDCSSDEYSKFKFEDFFQFMDKSAEKMSLESTLLTLAKNTTLAFLKKSDYLLNHIQPMHIEAFKVRFQNSV
jgi:alpha-mannosidase II